MYVHISTFTDRFLVQLLLIGLHLAVYSRYKVLFRKVLNTFEKQ
jgi:hypothetical protein